MAYSYGVEATLIDFDFVRCHAGVASGGFELSASACATMIRGSVKGCTAGSGYGAGLLIKGDESGGGLSTLSLIDVLIAGCVNQGSDSLGGGIHVEGILNMTGGAVLNCDSFNGGGLAIKGADAQAHLSGVAVRRCNADTDGGGIYMDAGEVSLVDVGIEECVAYTGGGIAETPATSGFTMVRAVHVRITRCHATGYAGAVILNGISTWTACTFSDCTAQQYNVCADNGAHTFLRCSIMRCHALGNGLLPGRGGGLGLEGGQATLIDSIIIGCSARDNGGCIVLAGGPAILRNTTLSSCSAPEGPYMSLESTGAATALVSELLTLEPSCDEEHDGALITVVSEFTAPLDVRGLQVRACASSNLSVVSEQVRLARCSDGDVCGDAANCADVVPLPSAPNLTTADCSCQGEFFPNPAGTSLALAPYGFVPSSVGLSGANIDYCVRWCRLESAQRQTCYSRPFTPRCRSPLASPPRPLSAASLSRP